ncbi:MAG TPA: hypothetical protein VF209_02300 [Patescibacteria group bacterium]
MAENEQNKHEQQDSSENGNRKKYRDHFVAFAATQPAITEQQLIAEAQRIWEQVIKPKNWNRDKEQRYHQAIFGGLKDALEVVKPQEVARKPEEINAVAAVYEEYKRLVPSQIPYDQTNNPNSPEGRLFQPGGLIYEQLVERAHWSEPTNVWPFFRNLRRAEEASTRVKDYASFKAFENELEAARRSEKVAGGTIVVTSRALLTPLEVKLAQYEDQYRGQFDESLFQQDTSAPTLKQNLEVIKRLDQAIQKIQRNDDLDSQRRAIVLLDNRREEFEMAANAVKAELLFVNLGQKEEERIESYVDSVINEFFSLRGEAVELPFNENEMFVWAETTLSESALYSIMDLWTKVDGYWPPEKNQKLSRAQLEQLGRIEEAANETKVTLEREHKTQSSVDDFAKKWKFLDVVANRARKLQEMQQSQTGQNHTESRAADTSGKKLEKGFSFEDVMKADVEKLNNEQLYAAGKALWGQLFARLETTVSANKKEINRKYEEIITVLKNRGEIWAIRAQYLDDRRNIYDALAIGTTSMMTVDYPSMYEGGAGWLGAKVPSQFDTGNILRMLYGSKLRLDLTSPDKEEQERLKSIDQILPIICELYSEYDPKTKKKGPFHATQQFSEGRKSAFRKQVQTIWKTEVLKLKPDQELNALQEEAFAVAWEMHIIVDLRTFYALPFYIAGWSPEDDIGKTIGLAAERFANGKGMYIVCGKGNQLVNPALTVADFSIDVENALDSDTKRNNYYFCRDYGTKIWESWTAPTLDEQPGLPDAAKLSFKRRSGEDSYVPAFYNSFWLPRTRREPAKLSSRTRDSLLTASREVDPTVAPTERAINLKGLLDGGKAAEEYAKACEAGFVPSDDMKKDAERIKKETLDIALKISPTKSLGTINGRILANYLYEYARLACLSFSEKHRKEDNLDEFYRHFARFIENLRSTIASAPTTEIDISEELIPKKFREWYGLPAGNLKIRDYVLALLPEGKELAFGGGKIEVRDEMMISGVKHRRKIQRSAKDYIISAIQYHPRRVHHNQEELNTYRGEKEPFFTGIKHKFQTLMAGGTATPYLHHEFHPQGDKEVRTSEEFYQALEIIPLSKQEKQAKEK